MAIDKIKLRALAKDKDERLFAEGDMLDAKNITVSTEGESTNGIVKNVLGTVPGTASTTDDQIPSEDARVVGSVSDDANQKVYFFVWSTSAANHGIYEYDTSNNTYKAVLKSSVLAFPQYGFVKADLINGDFQKNETNQTIIYFTDGVNAPRKINATRALLGEFDSYNDVDIKHAISVVKSPSLSAPTVVLKTDSSRTTNNLYGSVLQFAVQYVYKDGERSALSPHSKVVFPRHMSMQGIVSNDADIAASYTKENLAEINTGWTSTPSSLFGYSEEVSKIRILGRNKNTNPFFIVDEFDPNSSLVKNGSTVYDKDTGIYKFFNDGLYLYESSAVTDKVFDDVPQKAKSQAITGGRLMYSSPTSGYPNDATKATISVTYGTTPSVTFATDVSANTLSHAEDEVSMTNSTGAIRIPISGLPSTVPANTTIDIAFDYKPHDFAHWGFYDVGGGSSNADNALQKLNFTLGGTDTDLFVGEATNGSLILGAMGSTNLSILVGAGQNGEGAMFHNLNPNGIDFKRFSISLTTTTELTRTQVATKLKTKIEAEVARYKYFHAGDTINWRLRSSAGANGAVTHVMSSKELEFDLSFSVAVSGTDQNLDLSPRCWNWSLPQETLYDGANSGFGVSNKKVKITTAAATSTNLSGSINSIEEFSYFTGQYAPKTNANGFPLTGVERGFSNYNNAGTDDGAKEFLLFATQSFNRRTFKAGSNHKFGVVYFDEFGRPGYVNELGEVYVKPFGDSARSGNNGPCTISVDFTGGSPPSWAKSYQIVYSDMGSWESFETFVVCGGFYKKVQVDDGTGSTNTGGTGGSPDHKVQDSKIYLSLNGLTKLQNEKGVLKDYVFTPGDKLRIINYRDTTSSTSETYHATADADIFDVVGIETLTENIDSEIDETTSGAQTNRKGRFLVVSPPQGQDVTNFVPGTAANKFNNECLVEVLTPRKSPATEIFYEIGESRPVLGVRALTNTSFIDGSITPDNVADLHNDGEPIELTEGSVYYGARSVVTPNIYGSDTFFSTVNIEDLEFDARGMESMDASDFIESRAWSKGRAHVKYEGAATMNFPNRIVYSEEFNDPLDGITFSSFNPGSSSFKDLPRSFGSINYINEYNQNLVALQENKMSLIPVNRNVIEYADGSSAITANKSVLGTHKEANGDFGVGDDQSSVFARDGMVFFADKSRQKILVASGASMLPISDIEMSSFFEDEFDAVAAAAGNGGRVVTGYDPSNNVFYVTIEPKKNGDTVTYAGVTAGYSLSDKRWISKYSFLPSNYASIDNKMLSGFKYDASSVHYLFNAHTNATRNTFYGTAYPSTVKVVSKISPSQPKVFNAISYEASAGTWTVADEGINTNLNQNSKGAVAFTEKEGAYYAQFPKAKSDKYVYIGQGASNDGATITLSGMSRLNRLGVDAVGLSVFWESGGSYNVISSSNAINSYSQADGTITIVTAPGSQDFVNKGIYVKIETDEDSMRGHWAEIELTNSSTSAHELYCVNTHITPSKLHHPLGQQ